MTQALLPVLLAGGAGTRLWPLSRRLHPKPFLSLLGDGTPFGQTLARLGALEGSGLDLEAPVVVCNEEHRFLVAEEFRLANREPGAVILESVSRNTAPALCLAALHAAAEGSDPVLLALPSDHHIRDQDAFARAVRCALDCARRGGMVTFGVRPQAPETGYGYIRAAGTDGAGPLPVAEFVEKPAAARARGFLERGGWYWNSGMFMLRAGAWLEELGRFQPEVLAACREAMAAPVRDSVFVRPGSALSRAPSISVDRAVMERTDSAFVLPVDIGWSDVGTWTALAQAAAADAEGNVLRGDVTALDTTGSLVIAESRLVAALGLRGAVVVETPDAVLVADRDALTGAGDLVRTLAAAGRGETANHRRVVRPWGSYELLASGEGHQVKRLEVRPGAALSLQVHRRRSEHWVVVRGSVEVTRGGDTFVLRENESAYIPAGVRHRLTNPGDVPVEVIEVQAGDYLGEDDIERFEDDYGRA